jgi:hypothetical protein
MIMDPATLPVLPAEPRSTSAAVPVRSPDPAARAAAQRGAVAGPALPRPAAPRIPGPSAPAVNLTFGGLSENGFIPPDQALSAGPNHVVEMVNSQIEVFNKDGSAALGPFTLQQWFGGATNFVFDPVAQARHGSAVVNDVLRFYEVALYLNGTDSEIFIAASANNSGTSARCIYHLNGVIWGANTFSDFPKVGVTHDPNNEAFDRLLIGVNGFNSVTGAFVNNAVLELPKQAIDSCVGFTYTAWTGFTDANDNSIAFTPVPHVDYDNSSAFGWYVSFARFGSGSGLTVWRNLFGTGFQRFLVGTFAYSNPPGATQPGTTTRIDTIDDRLQSAVTRYGITTYAHAIDLGGCGAGNDTAVLHLPIINTPKSTGTPTLRQELFEIGACGTNQFNGAISQDSHGNPSWIYSESGTAEFVRPRIDSFHLIENAQGPNVDLITPCACIETEGRWGDFSAAVLDPLDQRFIWVGSEKLLGSNFWGTQIARILWSGGPI